jgi:hypothetical protein
MSDFEDYLKDVVGVVEATREEQMFLFTRNRAMPEPREWKENLSGYGKTVGELAGMPVFISLMTQKIDGKTILFYYATSVVVDHRLIDAWLEANLPKSAFKPDGKLNRSDCANWFQVLR